MCVQTSAARREVTQGSDFHVILQIKIKIVDMC